MARTKEDWDALRFEAAQLFTPSTPIAVAEFFSGRKKEIGQLFEAIAERGRHAIVYGERGVGKTSLSQVVPLMLPRGARQIHHIRKAADPSDNFTSIWRKVFRDIRIATLVDGQQTTVADPYADRDITPDDVVRELSSFNQNDVPIIVIDEFNEVFDEATPQLMANTIKGLSDNGVNATVVVVGMADNVNQLIAGHESVSRCCEEVLMPRMKQEELRDVIETRVAHLGMQIEGNAKWKIINLSKGLPTFVHGLGKFSCYAAIDRRRLMIVEGDTERAIETILEGSQQSLKQAFEKAVRSNQPTAKFRQVLTACALAKADESGFFTQTAVRGPLSQMLGRNIEIGHLRPQLHELIEDKRGKVIERIGEERGYRYRFSDPAMQPYVIMAGIKAGILTDAARSALSSQPDLFANLPSRSSSR
ncbi:MAG: AAA family ATPase [Fimbriimonadales bacterium]